MKSIAGVSALSAETPNKARGIIFTGASVPQIMRGVKTQTRRVMTPQPALIPMIDDAGQSLGKQWAMYIDSPDAKKRATWCEGEEPFWTHCPYGAIGDRLWVREAFSTSPDGPIYRATKAEHGITAPGDEYRWTPSIFMPRLASRLTLEITGVRVERLQDISENDAEHEGVSLTNVLDIPLWTADGSLEHRPLAARFAGRWRLLNGGRGYGWDSNPFVWVLEFSKIDAAAVAARRDA